MTYQPESDRINVPASKLIALPLAPSVSVLPSSGWPATTVGWTSSTVQLPGLLLSRAQSPLDV